MNSGFELPLKFSKQTDRLKKNLILKKSHIYFEPEHITQAFQLQNTNYFLEVDKNNSWKTTI